MSAECQRRAAGNGRTCKSALCCALSARPRSACKAGQTVARGQRLTPRFRTFQVHPKDLRALPGHPEPGVSWPSGFQEGAHARPKATRVHYAARRRGSVAARGARAAGGDAGDRVSWRRVARPVGELCTRVSTRPARYRLHRGPERGDRVSLGGGPHRSITGLGFRTGPPSSHRDCCTR